MTPARPCCAPTARPAHASLLQSASDHLPCSWSSLQIGEHKSSSRPERLCSSRQRPAWPCRSSILESHALVASRSSREISSASRRARRYASASRFCWRSRAHCSPSKHRTAPAGSVANNCASCEAKPQSAHTFQFPSMSLPSPRAPDESGVRSDCATLRPQPHYTPPLIEEAQIVHVPIDHREAPERLRQRARGTSPALEHRIEHHGHVRARLERGARLELVLLRERERQVQVRGQVRPQPHRPLRVVVELQVRERLEDRRVPNLAAIARMRRPPLDVSRPVHPHHQDQAELTSLPLEPLELAHHSPHERPAIPAIPARP